MNDDNATRPLTRATSREQGLLSRATGLDQPTALIEPRSTLEATQTTQIIHAAHPNTVPTTTRGENTMSDVQILIQESLKAMQTSMVSFKLSIERSQQKMQAQFAELEKKVSVNEGTHNVLREDFEYTEDPTCQQNTSEVADAGEVTDEDPIDLDPIGLNNNQVYSNTPAKGKYLGNRDVQHEANLQKEITTSERRCQKQGIARMRASTRLKTKSHSKHKPDPSGSSSSSSDSSSSDEPTRAFSSKNKKKSSKNKGDSESESNSDESVVFVPTKFRSLKNNKIKSKDLKEVLSYETYRLIDKVQIISGKLRKEIGTIATRMKAHIPDEQKFTGSDPVAVINS
jgi:hypothetical protein